MKRGLLCLVAGALVAFVPMLARDALGASPFDAAMAPIAGGTFVMGDDAGDPNEAPRPVTVGTFSLMRLEVTNRQFSAFVAAAGHRTDAERRGGGFVWDRTWRLVPGADWRHPNGKASSIDGRQSHPVVQISARDAAAFCAWYGLRLPDEAEWEFAARGAEGRRYPWGMDRPGTGRRRRANFGTVQCCAPDAADGYLRTAPVGEFPRGASPFGILDMAGNVWEWTSSAFPGQPRLVVLRGGGWGNDPYCLRTAYRHGNEPDIGLDMVGFRCAGNLTP